MADNNNKVVENGIKETNGVARRPGAAEPPEKKKRILEQLHYEDLAGDSGSTDVQELKLSKVSSIYRKILLSESSLSRNSIRRTSFSRTPPKVEKCMVPFPSTPKTSIT